MSRRGAGHRPSAAAAPATLLSTFRTMLVAALLTGPLAACGGDPVRPAAADAPPPTVPRGPYLPGVSYTGRNGYVEYLAGDAPVILAAPHGGALAPAEIAARGCGVVARDLHTRELTLAVRDAYHARTGRYPHVVVNHLARSRLDANRDAAEATCGDSLALVAWREWHAFLGVAREAVLRDGGRGWFMDVHGHGHAVPRLELGYGVDAAALALSDAALDAAPGPERASSVRTLSEAAAPGFAALLRGPASLGALYAAEGYPAVPAPDAPSPGGQPYFQGGYNTVRYGCADGGRLCGVQLEANHAGVRDTEANRARFAAATVRVLEHYLGTHWGLALRRAP